MLLDYDGRIVSEVSTRAQLVTLLGNGRQARAEVVGVSAPTERRTARLFTVWIANHFFASMFFFTAFDVV